MWLTKLEQHSVALSSADFEEGAPEGRGLGFGLFAVGSEAPRASARGILK
jgi:hypothetical protein